MSFPHDPALVLAGCVVVATVLNVVALRKRHSSKWEKPVTAASEFPVYITEIERLRKALTDETNAKNDREGRLQESRKRCETLESDLEKQRNKADENKNKAESLLNRVQQAEALAHSLQDANQQLQRGMDASQMKDLATPRVVPIRYGKENPEKVWAGIFLTNDEDEVAYDVKIEDIVIGRATDWKVSFSEIPRLAKGEERISLLQVSGRNTAPNLEWILDMWMKENSTRDSGGNLIPPDPLRMGIIYRQHGSPDKWYRSNCEIGHDAFQIGKETYVRFLNREEIKAPASSSVAGAL